MTMPPSPPFPSSLAYDPNLRWWFAKIDPDEFRPVHIESGEASGAAVSLDLMINLSRRAVKAGNIDISEAQARAYQYWLDNQQCVMDVCLGAIASAVPQQRAMLAQSFAPDVLEQLLPTNATAEQMTTRVRPTGIAIDFQERDGVAYVEYHFNAAWDKEHGIKVVLHNDRVVYVGGAGNGWSDR